MSYEKVGMVTAALLALGAIRCNSGTETDNPVGPLKVFQTTGCHGPAAKDMGPPPGTGGASGLGALGIALPDAVQMNVDGRYNHLSCVVWSRKGEELDFGLTNMSGGCGGYYESGSAEVDGDSVRLVAHNRDCMRTACGECNYDFAWSVAGVPEAGNLHVKYTEMDQNQAQCFGGVALGSDFTIPAGDAEGVRCHFVDYPVGGQGPTTDCSLHARCGGSFESQCVCGTGTVCTDNRCLATCTTDDECPLPGAFACVEGTCKPTGWDGTPGEAG